MLSCEKSTLRKVVFLCYLSSAWASIALQRKSLKSPQSNCKQYKYFYECRSSMCSWCSYEVCTDLEGCDTFGGPYKGKPKFVFTQVSPIVHLIRVESVFQIELDFNVSSSYKIKNNVYFSCKDNDRISQCFHIKAKIFSCRHNFKFIKVGENPVCKVIFNWGMESKLKGPIDELPLSSFQFLNFEIEEFQPTKLFPNSSGAIYLKIGHLYSLNNLSAYLHSSSITHKAPIENFTLGYYFFRFPQIDFKIGFTSLEIYFLDDKLAAKSIQVLDKPRFSLDQNWFYSETNLTFRGSHLDVLDRPLAKYFSKDKILIQQTPCFPGSSTQLSCKVFNISEGFKVWDLVVKLSSLLEINADFNSFNVMIYPKPYLTECDYYLVRQRFQFKLLLIQSEKFKDEIIDSYILESENTLAIDIARCMKVFQPQLELQLMNVYCDVGKLATQTYTFFCKYKSGIQATCNFYPKMTVPPPMEVAPTEESSGLMWIFVLAALLLFAILIIVALFMYERALDIEAHEARKIRKLKKAGKPIR